MRITAADSLPQALIKQDTILTLQFKEMIVFLKAEAEKRK